MVSTSDAPSGSGAEGTPRGGLAPRLDGVAVKLAQRDTAPFGYGIAYSVIANERAQDASQQPSSTCQGQAEGEDEDTLFSEQHIEQHSGHGQCTEELIATLRRGTVSGVNSYCHSSCSYRALCGKDRRVCVIAVP